MCTLLIIHLQYVAINLVLFEVLLLIPAWKAVGMSLVHAPNALRDKQISNSSFVVSVLHNDLVIILESTVNTY